MKSLKLPLLILVVFFGLTSCESVHVATDYDQNIDYNQYKTYAFYKPGIDKANISDLDKRRILRAIDTELSKKGFSKSEDPDLLISISTEATQNIDVYQNYYGWYGGNSVSQSIDGVLYINMIEAADKTLIWQGVGTGSLDPSAHTDEKVERVNEFVQKILERYPPQSKK